MLSIMIPSSLTMGTKDNRIRAYKVGQIARSACIYGVEEIIIYKDKEYDDTYFMETMLRYLETPQYMRKTLFGLIDELKYAGVVPPLRTPHHPLKKRISELREGEYREGLIKDISSKRGMSIDIGLDRRASAVKQPNTKYKVGGRVTTRIISNNPLKVELVPRSEVPDYWGYEVRIVPSMSGMLKKRGSSTIVFTSRKGKEVSIRDLGQISSKSNGIVFVFGSPARGVEEILSGEGCKTSDFSEHMYNAIPGQGTETVRLEEAVHATLALYNLAVRQNGQKEIGA